MCSKLRDDHHLPAAVRPLHALLTSIEDYAEDWESVLTDEEYVKLKGACGDARAVKQVQDKIDNADQTVQSQFRKAEHNLKQATEERDVLTKKDTAYPPMLAVDRQVDLVREVHAAAASIAARTARQA
jgi:hypothetical protein